MTAASTVTVRRGDPKDIETLGRLGALLVRLHHELDAKRFIPANSDTEERYGQFLGRQLDKPNDIVLVAERDGEAIGYTTLASRGAITWHCADPLVCCTT
ncbi:MAG: hypothetical protein ABI408_11875 [Gemmatimonadaceae bacterium]